MKALKAAQDAAFKENFIQESTQTILKLAAKSQNRFITVEDDEWSIALLAYNKAIDTYSADKGNFIPYAGVVIKRALIDHYRSEKKYGNEVPATPETLSGNGNPEEDATVHNAVGAASREIDNRLQHQNDMKEEILSVNERLKKYGFSFFDIADASPKKGKTKDACAVVIRAILENADMVLDVENAGRLAIKELSEKTGVSKKIIDRYRRYIVMAVIILNGEYPLLAEYLHYVRKGETG